MPHLQKTYLIDQFKKSNFYLEIGSGGSTVEASKYIKNIISIENSIEWIKKVKCHINPSSNVEFIFVNMPIKPNNGGNPNDNCSNENKRKYSQAIDNIDFNNIDLVLIDGRFRVACALHLFNKINNHTVVLFDDYIPRKQYHIIEKYYNIVEVIHNMVRIGKKM